MTVVFDNNILIDALADREPFKKDAQEVLKLAASGDLLGYISVNSVTDIYYVLHKTYNIEIAKDAIAKLLKLLRPIPITGIDCEQALISAITDFEDALIMVCATKVSADYVVSRDTAFQKSESLIPVISATKLLDICL